MAAVVLIAAGLAVSATGQAATPTDRGQQPETGIEPGQPVRIAIPRVDPGLTPYQVEVNVDLMHLIYDTLTWRNQEGEPIPWLAEAVEVSEDGRSATVRLRKGARWHDGTPVTAADVAFTYRLFRDRPHPRFTPQLEAVESVQEVDARNVRFDLRHPTLGLRISRSPICRSCRSTSGPDWGRGDTFGPCALGSGLDRLVAESEGGYRLVAAPGYFRGRPTPRDLRPALWVLEPSGLRRSRTAGSTSARSRSPTWPTLGSGCCRGPPTRAPHSS